MVDDIASVAEWLRSAQRVVVLTGAGISTDSGIPDFRGPNGVWTKDPQAEKMATLQHYLADPEIRRRAWKSRLDHVAWTAEPNAGHRALVRLQDQDRLVAVITQNVDELHQKAGIDPDRVIEVHGTIRRYQCLMCGDEGPMEFMLDRVRRGEDDPPCHICGGIVKSATISFGQPLVPDVIDRALFVAGECDVFLAVGSTLQVYPVAGAVPRAKAAGAVLVIVNAEPTAFDPVADAVLRGSISEILPAVVG